MLVPLFIASVLFFILRIWMAFAVRETVYSQGDLINHLHFLRSCLENRGKIVQQIKGYLLDENDYPNGFHKLCSLTRLPLSFFEQYGGALPILFDFLLLLMVAWAMCALGGEAFWWIVLFPLLRLPLSHFGRAALFGERAFGVLCCNGYLLSAVLFYSYGKAVFLLPALFFFTAFSTSSKFSWQAAIFYTLLLSLCCVSLAFLLCFLCCFVGSFLLTKGYSVHVLQGLIRHSRFYRAHYDGRYLHQRDHYKEIFSLFRPFRLCKIKEFVLHNSLAKMFSEVPLHLVTLVLWIQYGIEGVFSWWVLSGMVLTMLIATKTFRFLGEPERYCEYSLIPLFVLLSHYGFTDLPFTTISVGVITIFFALYHMRHVNRCSRQMGENDAQVQELLAFLSEKEPQTFLTIPLRLSYLIGYHQRKSKYVNLFANVPRGEKRKKYRRLVPDLYPYPGRDLQGYVQEYDVDYIICDKISISVIENQVQSGYYDLSQYNRCYENDRFAVYQAV